MALRYANGDISGIKMYPDDNVLIPEQNRTPSGRHYLLLDTGHLLLPFSSHSRQSIRPLQFELMR